MAPCGSGGLPSCTPFGEQDSSMVKGVDASLAAQILILTEPLRHCAVPD